MPGLKHERLCVAPVAGVDEAGRGPLAGPVVAAAVILPPKGVPRGLNDSKKLSAAERDLIIEALRLDNGNRESVAKRLGISPRTLRYKLARLREAGVEVPAA